jgi:hypothetical protein
MTRLFIASLLLTIAAAPASPRLLRTLSDRDMMHFHDMGCDFGFGPGNDTYLYGRNQDLMMRVGPASGDLRVCHFPEPKITAFEEGRAGLSCGDFDLRLRRTGKSTSSMEADSSSWPATLTIQHERIAKRRQFIRGTAGVAC